MHQTFYIDVDEEMSSVIDRLNKSMSMENYFVVPKRALFLQSIVNLKILKREADKMSKRVIIVTQDETVISMAERSGIEIRESLESVESAPEAYMDEMEEESEMDSDEEIEEEFEKKIQVNDDKQKRLKNIGSVEYYQSGNDNNNQLAATLKGVKQATAMKAIKNQAKNLKKRPEKIVLQKVAKPSSLKSDTRVNSVGHTKVAKSTLKSTNNSIFKNDLDPHKAQTLEKLFAGFENHESPEKNRNKNIGSGKVKKVFTLFMLLCVFVFLGLAAYLFVPSAKIIINADVNKKKVDTEIAALADVVLNEKNIPLRVIDKENQVSISYEVKGVSEAVGKKAKGKVIIHNVYSSESQTLVATTRLEAENGKIFRLVKNVIVPGSSTVNGEIKPGVIQAEIVADQAGSEFNMESSKFTVPGFAGGPKFDKFYALSDLAIVGGSSEGESQSVARLVTQADLDNAKQKAEAAFKEEMIQELKGDLSKNEISLEQAQKVSIIKSSTISKVGSVTDSIEWVVSGSAKALVFNEEDVKKVVLSLANDNNEKTGKVKNEISKIDYGSVEPDFDKSSLRIRVYCEVTSVPVVNTDQIKNELLGKSDSQVADVLRKYSFIKSANVEFSPSFMTRIPTYDSRVNIEVINEAK
ncbi:MAG: hypothetical protein ACD_5C00338G0003 [uncultured bacterium]|nr:MAG: hypothetical protein ACD_5C00338G0003 [uncultured bacterium]